MCDQSDIIDGTSFVNHLVTIHNAVSSGGEEIRRDRIIGKGRQRLVPKEGDRIIAMWGESKWQYFTACIQR